MGSEHKANRLSMFFNPAKSLRSFLSAFFLIFCSLSTQIDFYYFLFIIDLIKKCHQSSSSSSSRFMIICDSSSFVWFPFCFLTSLDWFLVLGSLYLSLACFYLILMRSFLFSFIFFFFFHFNFRFSSSIFLFSQCLCRL